MVAVFLKVVTNSLVNVLPFVTLSGAGTMVVGSAGSKGGQVK